MNYKNIIYSLLCLSFTVIVGGAIYEHIAVVPQWSAAPPKSLSMFQGEYGLYAEGFWKIIHPVTLLLFIVTLVISWKTARRSNLLYAFLGYIAILIITTFYFVPELIAITSTPYSDEMNAGLIDRAAMWETGSLIRLMILIILSIILFLGLTKNPIIVEKH